MRFGALGDIHGDFESARRIMQRHAEVPFWLCVGDVATADGRYEPLPSPLYWIKGNNENFDAIEGSGHTALTRRSADERFGPEALTHRSADERSGPEAPTHRTADERSGPEAPTHRSADERSGPEALTHRSADERSGPAALTHSRALTNLNLYHIPNGVLIEIPVGQPFTGWLLRVAGLGGTLAPTWYDTPAHELPHPKKGSATATALADKRRHFVREEVEACKALGGIDVFMSHEAPRPYRVGRMDAGKTPINEVLSSMKPHLHLFGHHHRFSDQTRQRVRSVGLDLVSQSYLLVDAESLDFERYGPGGETPA